MIKGIIEGFYGKEWSWQDRNSYPQFLNAIGYNSYVYAPKADVYLRQQWQSPWPQDTFQQLKVLSDTCHHNNIQFGVGLSPLAAFENAASSFSDLESRLAQILQLSPDILAIQFDDMTGSDRAFLDFQLQFCEQVEKHVPSNVTLIMCPSYYSTDPVLEEYFGQMSDRYWQRLGQGLSQRWQIFWTGQNVVTLDYDEQGLLDIAGKFQRKPLLWDNYPVNDGRLLWPFINTLEKPRSHLADSVSGYLHNPMNQAWCSKVAIAEIAGFGEAICDLLGVQPSHWQWFDQYRNEFQTIGLHKMTTQTKQHLLQFAALNTHPLVSEVEKWLQGYYEFDPACLT